MIDIDITVVHALADSEKFREVLGASGNSDGVLGVDANSLRDVVAFMSDLEDIVAEANPQLGGVEIFALLVAGKRRLPFGSANYEFPNVKLVSSAT